MLTLGTHSFHDRASNAKFMMPLLGTGGSWKKSPTRTSWIPPNGRSFWRVRRPTYSSLSKKRPSICRGTHRTCHLVSDGVGSMEGERGRPHHRDLINDQHVGRQPSFQGRLCYHNIRWADSQRLSDNSLNLISHASRYSL